MEGGLPCRENVEKTEFLKQNAEFFRALHEGISSGSAEKTVKKAEKAEF